MSDLLLQAMNAKQSGNISLTKQLLAQALIQNPQNEGAWMLMYEVVDDVKLKRNCLERALAINPDNTTASIALMKLVTSPLGPIVRGERFKPIIPPKPEKAAPFTPPFTWTGDESQFQALGDMTFPDLPDEEPNPPSETPATFDWATDSGEPDKTIDKIFEAVSNPEKVSQPPPDIDLSWMVQDQTEGQAQETASLEGEDEASLQDEPESLISEALPGQQPVSQEDFKVSAEPEWGMDAFAYTEETISRVAEAEALLWDNPKAKVDRMIILGDKSIIYANPAASDVPHIMGLFNEKKMLRDLLGENAGVIKLESIKRVSANPKRSHLDITYQQNEKSITHQLTFINPHVRDEALAALQLRLSADFARHPHTYRLLDKIENPILCILLIAALGWGLTAGLPLLTGASAFQSGTPQLILSNLQYYVDLVGTFNLLVIAVLLVAVCMIWLVINLSKPTRLVIVEQPKPKKS
ncbi:MAG: hypothetical protein A2Z71_01030 [Chloroflexi bacterium RBG_13_50_21]|nr:MAG: hypothetical protein A2Z71_01030 [Chloroflexi bacterium RBG_13_50_21]